MKAQEIHARLRTRFGDAIADWREPAAGDSTLVVKAEALHEVCRYLRDEQDLAFDFLRLLTAVDRTECFSSVYHLYSYNHQQEIVLRVDLPRDVPRVASVADIWHAAEWHEREAFDMMGVLYDGHPDLRRILLPLDWDGYPLRKDYKQPAEYHGISNDE